MKEVNIALDAMGGDLGVEEIISGANLFLQKAKHKYKNINTSFSIYGHKEQIIRYKKKYNKVFDVSTIVETKTIVDNNDKPLHALRNKRDSSMYLAVQSVRDGINDCVVSCGNTGALFLISKYILGTIDGISRPAILGIFPNIKGSSVLLDMGANLECNSDALVQFAYMGSAFAKAVLEISFPTVSLINVGTEASKGTDSIKETYQILSSLPDKLNFKGYIEPLNIFTNPVDVVVSDGFVGNILLKTMEGTFYFIVQSLKIAGSKSFLKIYLLILIILKYCIFRKFIKSLKPDNWNGALIAGINNIVVKSHGSANRKGIATAIEVAFKAVKNDLNENIIENIEI